MDCDIWVLVSLSNTTTTINTHARIRTIALITSKTLILMNFLQTKYDLQPDKIYSRDCFS